MIALITRLNHPHISSQDQIDTLDQLIAPTTKSFFSNTVILKHLPFVFKFTFSLSLILSLVLVIYFLTSLNDDEEEETKGSKFTKNSHVQNFNNDSLNLNVLRPVRSRKSSSISIPSLDPILELEEQTIDPLEDQNNQTVSTKPTGSLTSERNTSATSVSLVSNEPVITAPSSPSLGSFNNSPVATQLYFHNFGSTNGSFEDLRNGSNFFKLGNVDI
ncbi:hypothetical protein WICPIJ_002648 [Wickerhamomyces pijperi]|uniref:Uncharacterized protein n=1 Tax=Wickerhamomyces pijperi TaxID=599730 RepID=A0A9P8TPM7_WICPI|nr:hypothetical protein WICPIJ_002648 [Wickerhamomyces pijperi]